MIFNRVARTAGKNPPKMPITSEKIRVPIMISGDIRKPKASSENEEKFVVEKLKKDMSDASAMPTLPPIIAMKIDSTRNAR